MSSFGDKSEFISKTLPLLHDYASTIQRKVEDVENENPNGRVIKCFFWVRDNAKNYADGEVSGSAPHLHQFKVGDKLEFWRQTNEIVPGKGDFQGQTGVVMGNPQNGVLVLGTRQAHTMSDSD